MLRQKFLYPASFLKVKNNFYSTVTDFAKFLGINIKFFNDAT